MIDINQGKQFIGHTGSVYVLRESWNEGSFFSGGSDGMLVQWNLHDDFNGIVIAKIPDVIFSIYVDKHQRIIYVGTQKGYLFVINTETKVLPRQIQFHTGPLFGICAYQESLFGISGDGLISQFNKGDLRFINSVKIGPVGLRSFFMDKVNDQLFVGDRQGSIFSYHFKSGVVNRIVQIESKKTIFSLHYNALTNRLIIGGMDAQLHYYQLDQDELFQNTIDAHWYTINSIVKLDPYKLIVSGSRDRSIRIWDEVTLELLKEISMTKYKAHTYSVNYLLWMEKEKVLLSASDDKTIKSWIITNV